MQMRWLFPLLAACAGACSGDSVPLAATDLVAPEAAAEASGGVQAFGAGSGCYGVQFDVDGNFPTFDVSGDLEGSVAFSFDIPGSLWSAGVTVKYEGTAQWNVTGGNVPGLESFETAFDNIDLVIDRPGSPDTFFENLGKHRALSGVEKANLTYRGTFDLLRSPPLHHDFEGVICP